jgi:hypothetical protein
MSLPIRKSATKKGVAADLEISNENCVAAD